MNNNENYVYLSGIEVKRRIRRQMREIEFMERWWDRRIFGTTKLSPK